MVAIEHKLLCKSTIKYLGLSTADCTAHVGKSGALLVIYQ